MSPSSSRAISAPNSLSQLVVSVEDEWRGEEEEEQQEGGSDKVEKHALRAGRDKGKSRASGGIDALSLIKVELHKIPGLSKEDFKRIAKGSLVQFNKSEWAARLPLLETVPHDLSAFVVDLVTQQCTLVNPTIADSFVP
jgi:hypothetical protein